MAVEETTTLLAQPTILCPHGYGSACPICAVTAEVLRTFPDNRNRSTFDELLILCVRGGHRG